jgi:hypothetical protein
MKPISYRGVLPFPADLWRAGIYGFRTIAVRVARPSNSEKFTNASERGSQFESPLLHQEVRASSGGFRARKTRRHYGRLARLHRVWDARLPRFPGQRAQTGLRVCVPRKSASQMPGQTVRSRVPPTASTTTIEGTARPSGSPGLWSWARSAAGSPKDGKAKMQAEVSSRLRPWRIRGDVRR